MRNVLGWDHDGGAGLRVAPFAGWAVIQRKTAEATDLYPAPMGQRMGQLVEYHADGQIDVLEGKLGKGQGEVLDDFVAGHGYSGF